MQPILAPQPFPALHAPPPDRTSFALSWDEATRAFLVDLASRGFSALTLRDYQGDVDRLMRSTTVAPSELTERKIEEALSKWRGEGAAPSALRRHRSALRKFLNFLGRSTAVTCGAAELWSRMKAAPSADRLLLGLVAAAGARLPELCALEGRDLRVKSGEVRLRAGMRIVPMHPALAALVGELRADLPATPFRPVLGGRQGFAVNTRTMHARFRRAATRLGAPDLRPDDLRRELAAHLVSLKTPSGLVSAFLGRDRGRPVAPRRGALTDLSCLFERLSTFPLEGRSSDEDRRGAEEGG